MVHIYMGSIKASYGLLWGVAEIISCFHWHLILQNARILIIGDGFGHVLEITLLKGREFALYQTDIQGSMSAMLDPHLGSATPFAYHRICMRHLASNFLTRFKEKMLNNLVCRAASARTERKF